MCIHFFGGPCIYTHTHTYIHINILTYSQVMYGLKSLICELQQQAGFPYTYKNKKPVSLQFLANILTHEFLFHSAVTHVKVTLRTHTQYPVTHLQSVTAWKRLNASIQLKLQVNIYANYLLFGTVEKKNQLDVTFCILCFSSTSCSTCFGQPCAHHQKLTTA